jgi:RNase P subunit RPR2
LYLFISTGYLALKSVDIKARKRVEELYELTDEIINAYNEINEKYVHQIYRKFKQLQEINKKLKEKLTDHHCTGCKCSVPSANEEEEGEEEEEEEEESEHSIADEEDDEQAKNSTLPSSTTRTKKKNR